MGFRKVRKAARRQKVTGGDTSCDTMSSDRLKLPGFGLPVNFLPDDAPKDPYASKFGRNKVHDPIARFPSAILDWEPSAFTVRERNMVAFMDIITDKPEWRRKVFDEDIIQKWKTECLGKNWDFSEQMFKYSIAELQHKAEESDDHSADIITTLAVSAAVAKSDSIVPDELKEALRAAVRPLEEVPDHQKDWHPNSDEQVLDLVHPSLFPVIYGKTKIIPEAGMNVGLEGGSAFTGSGETIPKPSDKVVTVENTDRGLHSYSQAKLFWSERFQWLPCDVSIIDSEPGVRITSYINNLHPVHHAHLYPIIERYIAKAVPFWNAVLREVDPDIRPRIFLHEPHGYEFDCDFEDREGQEDEPPNASDDWVFRRDWERAHRTIVRPEPPPFKPIRDPISGPTPPLDLRTEFTKTGLQVIVKLANIHLTPDKPSYPGGSWHVEGMLNEHICATALYYYSSANITESRLEFRQRCNAEGLLYVAYDQDDYEGVEELYDVQQEGPGIQEIGSVVTKEGRMLAFPNVVQHRVMPFELADKTKPGHRKILALFLVDPHIRVISSANVPPQQKSWWAEVVRADAELGGSINKLPQEIFEATVNSVTDFPISLEEAKELREELMSERTVYVDEVNKAMDRNTFFFCEH